MRGIVVSYQIFSGIFGCLLVTIVSPYTTPAKTNTQTKPSITTYLGTYSGMDYTEIDCGVIMNIIIIALVSGYGCGVINVQG